MPGDDDDTVLAQASEPPQTTVHGRERHGWQRHAFAITVAAVVLVLVLTGTTLSSMAAVGGGDGSDAGSGVVVGTPRELRTDEYLRTSPWRLGAIADPDLSFASPLSDDSALATTVTSHGVITRLVFFDSLIIELGHLTSTSMAFALLWWLPTLLLFACGPTLLTRFGVPRV
ncbi:MAG TPA: hypothetical protein PLV68_08310, partial [Ilumatobacteraceae bacterium]|nr:hypothetical protein [Ilumatobacteraceae bacterium]